MAKLNSYVRWALIVAAFIVAPHISYAQDTTNTEVHDVIYLTKGGLIKGKLLSLNPETGVVIFEDLYRRKYTLGREEYDHIVEDKVFPVKQKRVVTIHEPRSSGWGFSAGIDAGLMPLKLDLEPDDYYWDAQDDYSYVPLMLNLNFGKYISNKLYVGGAIDLPISSYANRTLNFGARAVSSIPNTSSNLNVYFPAEVYFNTMEFDANYTIADTTFADGGWSYPGWLENPIKVSSLGISLGTGVALNLKNRRSLGLELSVYKHAILSSEQVGDLLKQPNVQVGISGVRFALMYNL